MLVDENSYFKRRGRNPFFAIMVSLMVCLMLFITIMPQEVKADVEPKLDIKTEIGLTSSTNYMKEKRMNPVKLILTSTDVDLMGDVVIQIANPNGGKDISYVQHVELPKGVSKEVWFTLPGGQYSKDNNVIRFYRDSLSKGNNVPFTSGEDYLYATSSNSASVGVLSEDSDTFNFLTLLRGQNLDLQVNPLKAEKFPANSLMYDSLDILAINQFPSETLSQGQVEAITSWVNSGGTLILSGGAGIAKTTQAFEKLLPVQLEGTIAVQDLSVLANMTGRELQLTEPFTLSKAKPLPDSEVVMEQNGIPLIVSKSYGNGKVLYAAFDVALQPLANWNGHHILWGDLLKEEFAEYNQQSNIRYGGGGVYWQIDNALDYFPSIQSPPFSLLVVLLIIYAIIVAPILYLILKYFDKREWSWVIIPSIAIVSSIGIFFAGASNKASMIGHTLTSIELNGDGQGNRSGGVALFVPNSGDYTLSLNNKTFPTAFDTISRGQQGLHGESDLQIRSVEDATELEFKKVPFWSVRKAMLQENGIQQLGAIESELFVNASGQMEGKVTNNTLSDLKDAFILFDGQTVKLGDIRRKDTVSYTLATSISNTMYYGDLGYMVYPHSGSNDTFERQRQLLNFHSNRNLSLNTGLPSFFAWSEDQGIDFTVDGQKIKNDQLTLWSQQIELNLVKDKQITVPRGYIKPTITEVNSQSFGQDKMSQTINLSDGYVVVEYRLPSVANAKFTELVIDNMNQNVVVELWDAVKKAWVKVDLSTAYTLDQAALAPFIDRGKYIQMKFSIITGGDIRMPEIAVKGEVSP